MTSSLSPTWYDVLGVDRDASPDQIKAAWRTSTDRFEPGSGSGQFRMFNEAADVLLDPSSRAAYDATLADGPPVQTSAAAPAATSPRTVAPVSLSKEPVADREPVEDRPDAKNAVDEEPGPEPARASRFAVVLAVVLALLTVVALVTAGFLGLKVRTDARVADAREQAPASAERAAKAMLGYDYRTLPADRRRASAFLTPSFKATYLKNFSLLEKQKDGSPGAAVQTKTVVTASVVGSGVMDAEDGVARVLVYVNQVSKKPSVDAQIFQNRVTMTMQKHGNKWLVDDLKSY